VTLIPALAQRASHVTMLQRTPSYILSLPSEDRLANVLKKLLPARRAYDLIRRKNIAAQRAIWLLCKKYPRAARRMIRSFNAKRLPKGYPVDEHFNPPYDPWDQRLCLVPNGDLFKAIRDGGASVVTDHIETFTERGIRLKSGRELEADIIVTATGLNLQLFGGIKLTLDGEPANLAQRVAFKGVMLDGIPNFAFAIGYTNASWTLKIGLLCEFFCRLLAHMDKNGFTVCVPERDPAMQTMPLLDFGAGYVKRALHELPRQGERVPWRTAMSYYDDVELLRHGSIDDGNLRFSAPSKQTVHRSSLDASLPT
jgi:cation diffusion facilitator CzcD-associated flavoprotein CzcO